MGVGGRRSGHSLSVFHPYDLFRVVQFRFSLRSGLPTACVGMFLVLYAKVSRDQGLLLRSSYHATAARVANRHDGVLRVRRFC